VVSHLHFDDNAQPHYSPASTQRIAPRAQLMRDWDDEDIEGFRTLLRRLPEFIRAEIEAIALREKKASLIEILLQGHRPPVLRFADDTERDLSTFVSVDEALGLLLDDRPEGEVFSSDNRAGIPGTLHRVAATRDRLGRVIALTYRIGRHKPGSAVAAITDVVAGLKRQQSLLVVGPPGCGKTTLLRDITRTLADEYRLRSVVVDTSMEIAGDDAAPHACIGRALRMPVASRRQQPEVLLEAVQNQTPQVIIVDEIGTRAEVDAACSISQRGVGLVIGCCLDGSAHICPQVATAHGKSLQNILSNHELRPLLGHFQLVTLNAEEARILSPSRGGVPKRSRLERTSRPAFSSVVEVLGRNHWRVYNKISGAIDDHLAGKTPVAEDRWLVTRTPSYPVWRSFLTDQVGR
jgi:stage III sporulation protein SpoIIIAA